MREALKLIEKRFLGSALGKEYVPRLSAEATEALNRLKKRFGAPDKFVVIRDNFAFHHPSLDDMEAAFQLAIKSDGDDTDWCMYRKSSILGAFSISVTGVAVSSPKYLMKIASAKPNANVDRSLAIGAISRASLIFARSAYRLCPPRRPRDAL